MTLDTGTKVAREKFHLLPMLDVVVSHLNSLAAKGKKMISKEPAFLYHGLVIPDDTPTSDLDDTHFSPLPTEAPHPTTDHSSHPPDDHDSSNHGGEKTETEEPQREKSDTYGADYPDYIPTTCQSKELSKHMEI